MESTLGRDLIFARKLDLTLNDELIKKEAESLQRKELALVKHLVFARHWGRVSVLL